MADLSGKTLCNRYRILSSIGKGGMAEVYKARDEVNDFDLAIKVLKIELAQDRAFLDHFREEAITLSSLRHENIVRFYNFERDGNNFFIVMDFVDGDTLREEMRDLNAPFSSNRILEVMRGVCSALDYAHRKGYVHRDIKPSNILISRDGKIYVTDFGIARISKSAPSALGQIGTPGYMSPEQIRRESTTPASDLYSLGILLYEMATGRRPFLGQVPNTTSTPSQRSERVRQEHLYSLPPSPRQYNPEISPQLEWIILRCLEKEPSARFLSAVDLLQHLEKISLYDSGMIIPKTQKSLPPQPADEKIDRNISRPQKRKNAVLWLLGSSVILILAFLFIQGELTGNMFSELTIPTNNINVLPATQILSQPTVPVFQPSFFVRPYNAYTDSGIQPLWGKVVDYAEITSPGRLNWETNISSADSVLLNLTWCAAEQITLNENVAVMEFSITIDGVSVSDSQLSIFNGGQGSQYCHYRKGVLSGLSQGQHKYVETMRFKNAVSDRTTIYNAGDYIYELTINAQ